MREGEREVRGSRGWCVPGGMGGTQKRPDVACDQKHVTKSGNRWAESVAVTSITAVFRDTLNTSFFAFRIIYLFWPSDDAYFLLHQSKRASNLFLLRT